jgi:hypothetical protein
VNKLNTTFLSFCTLFLVLGCTPKIETKAYPVFLDPSIDISDRSNDNLNKTGQGYFKSVTNGSFSPKQKSLFMNKSAAKLLLFL